MGNDGPSLGGTIITIIKITQLKYKQGNKEPKQQNPILIK
jgi:hypothetical protein